MFNWWKMELPHREMIKKPGEVILDSNDGELSLSKSWVEKYGLPIFKTLTVGSALSMVAILALVRTKVLAESFFPMAYVCGAFFGGFALASLSLDIYFSEKYLQNQNLKLDFTASQQCHNDKKQNSFYSSEVKAKNLALLIDINNDFLTEVNKEMAVIPLSKDVTAPTKKTIIPKINYIM